MLTWKATNNVNTDTILMVETKQNQRKETCEKLTNGLPFLGKIGEMLSVMWSTKKYIGILFQILNMLAWI